MNFVLRRRFHSPTNACDPAQNPVVPFGANGAGQWTGHPVGLLVVVGVLLIALIGLPAIRLFFLFSSLIGALFGSLLWRRHRRRLFQGEIVPFGRIGEGSLSERLPGLAFFALGVLLTAFIDVRLPIIKLFIFVAAPVGCIVGLMLWLHQREGQQSLFSNKP